MRWIADSRSARDRCHQVPPVSMSGTDREGGGLSCDGGSRRLWRSTRLLLAGSLVSVLLAACGGQPSALEYRAACGQITAAARAEAAGQARFRTPGDGAAVELPHIRDGVADARWSHDADFVGAFADMAANLQRVARLSGSQERSAGEATEMAAMAVGEICRLHHAALRPIEASFSP
jgi:hypothetical protein